MEIKKVKIVYSSGATLGSGGVGVHAAEAVKQLAKAGVLEKVYCAGISDSVSLLRNSKIFPVEMPWKIPGHRYFYPNWIKDILYDYLTNTDISKSQHTEGSRFFHFWNGHGLKTARAAKKKGFITIVERNSLHPLDQEATLQKEFKKFNLKYSPTHQISLKRNIKELEEADFVACPSELVYESLLRAGLPKEKVWKPNALGVNFEHYSDITPKPPLEQGLNFIFVGGDPIRKGLYYLLKAWEKISSQQLTNSNHLFIIGTPPKVFDSAPFAYFKGLKGVEVSGWVNVKEYYEKSHVFVTPSIEDGWGMVLSEAMAAGLAVITSSSMGASEMVTKETGFVVEPGSIKELTEKIEYFTKNPEKALAMGKKAQEAAKAYTWERYGNQLLKNYQELI